MKYAYEVLGLVEQREFFLERFEVPTQEGWENLVGLVKGDRWLWNGLGRVFTPAGGRLFCLIVTFEPIPRPVTRQRYPPDFD